MRRPAAAPVHKEQAAPWTARIRAGHVAVAIGLLHLVLVLLTLQPQPHDGGDNAAYLALARSLQENGTYQELWDPAARPHTQYPPGWPLILAGAMSVGIGPWVGFKVIAALFSALAVALSYLWARRVSTAGTALAIGVMLAVGTGVADTGRWELSDPPFWAFTMLALLAFARVQQERAATEDTSLPTSTSSRWKALRGPLAVAAVATLLAYMTRSAGLPLVVAGVGWLLWRRQWRRTAAFVLVIAPFAVYWWLRGRMAGAPGYASYLWYVDPYRPMLGTVGVDGMLARVGRNTVEYASEQLAFLLTGVRAGLPAALLGIGIALLALVGWGMRMRRAGLAELWLPLYMGLVLVWPGEWASSHFLLPALPMILLCAAEPVRLAAARAGRAMVVGAGATGVVVLAGIQPLATQVDQAIQCRAAYGPSNLFPCLAEPWADFMELSRSLRGALPDGSVVLSRKPTLFWAYSGYPSRTYPFTDNPDSLLAVAREAGARYILLDYMDQISVMYLAPVLMQRPQAFCVMTGVGPGRATLMGIQPGAEQMPNARPRPGDEAMTLPFRGCTPDFWAPSP